jgi:hypothetical protein
MADPELDRDAAILWLAVPLLPVLLILFMAGCP